MNMNKMFFTIMQKSAFFVSSRPLATYNVVEG